MSMSYYDYVDQFIGISINEWEEVVNMFPNVSIDETITDNLSVDSNKDHLIAEIICHECDPDYEYIDDIEIDEDLIKIYEMCDVEDLEYKRDEVKALLGYSNYKVEFIEG